MSGNYDDMIHLPRHISKTRPRMPAEKRAAQFAPFSALTGYNAAILEAARLTDERIDLGEDRLADLDRKQRILIDRIADRPEAAVIYFQEDGRKAGGAYVTATGVVKKIDDSEGVIVLAGGERIPMADIWDIQSPLFVDLP